MKRLNWLIFLVLFGVQLSAKVKPVAYYNFGEAGNVTYAVAPEVLAPQIGNQNLLVVGHPVFYADSPPNGTMRGHGCLLFGGKEDGYRSPYAFGQPSDNMVLEIWAKARDLEGEDAVVVAHGDEKAGYLIIQRGKLWILVANGVAVAVIGEVDVDKWTHLAAVLDDGVGTVWIDGNKTKTFRPIKRLAPNFSIAVGDKNESFFHGEIYEVRYSTFNAGQFQPEIDFLLNNEGPKQKDQKKIAIRKALIHHIQTSGVGKQVVRRFPEKQLNQDWLISSLKDSCRMFVKQSMDGMTSMFQLNNGLVSRTFYVSENVACVGYRNLSNGAEYLRAVKPEARICLDSMWYEVGGLTEQPEKSYLLESWYPQLKASHQAFTLAKVETGLPLKRYPWHPKYHSIVTDWPTKGLRMEMTFVPTSSMTLVKDIEVKVNYEIYQGLPIMAKWIEVVNKGTSKVLLNDMECEVLAVSQDQVERLHVESDYSFALVNADMQGSALMHYSGTPKAYHVGQSTTKWVVDPEYKTWASHNQADDRFLNFPHHCLLLSKLPMGPHTTVLTEMPFKSFITFELMQDSDDRERKSLAHRRFYKYLAPQTTESLIAGGITSHDEKKLKLFIDQMNEIGLERLDIMAWPGVSHDNLDSTYVQHWRRIASYARERGIIMGGYELQIASRGRGEEVNCINPETGKQGSLFGQSVCISSKWKDLYYEKMWQFYDRTGFKSYNMDGPYHGDPCASVVHAYHSGLLDSQWKQWTTQVEVLHELQRRDVYIPIPDWYFLNGQCATGMGYREASANLTPQQQMLLGRQYIYDGTWHKMPTMGWMGLQLVGFYTNDPRVGLEPLCDNLDRYEQQLIQYLASGCALTIRGNRLYDTPQTKAMVKKWIHWFKTYRDILTSDIIHVSRPTGRDIDCIMHVNPFINHRGMVVVFNPTDREIVKKINLPLYYTGLKDRVTIMTEDGIKRMITLDEFARASLSVTVKAGKTVWFLIEK